MDRLAIKIKNSNLKVFQTINSSNRVSSIDIFRSIAILAVVTYHFNHYLPFGFLGVDLFFIISGLLIGGLLIKEIKSGKRINYFKFFLQRGFKIWPSYYVFIFLGNLLAFFLYRTSYPNEIIPFWDLKRYLFFYQNYTGTPYHWLFDHIWSLCVEEHFYIFLPLLFILIQLFIKEKFKIKALFIFVIVTIVSGIWLKYFSYFYTTGQDTYSATHNRIDSLAWGVLLSLLINYYGENIKALKFKCLIFLMGFFVFIIALYFSIKFDNVLFEKIYFHSIIPFSFFLMVLSSYFSNFYKLKIFRFIAYYSYNWYLWHPLFVFIVLKLFGNTFIGFLSYLIITFIIAMVFTIVIEEFFLRKRNVILSKLFKTKNK